MASMNGRTDYFEFAAGGFLLWFLMPFQIYVAKSPYVRVFSEDLKIKANQAVVVGFLTLLARRLQHNHINAG